MVKLLLFSDVHANVTYCREIVKQAADVEIVVGAGDLGNFRRGLKTSIDILREISKPAILVPGNSESDGELALACRDWPQAIVLHGRGAEVKGVFFYGIGGGIPTTPFGSWSYDFTETQAEQLLADCPTSCVLVSHSPPKGVVDVSSSGRSLGSRAIRRVIEERRPKLVVCGHIHQNAGKYEMLGQTPVVNAGPRGYIWEL